MPSDPTEATALGLDELDHGTIGEVSAAGMKNKLHVLVVEDDEAIRDVIGLALDSAGHRSSTAPNGAVALDLLAREDPDVIVLDIRMPLMDGLEFALRYRTGGGLAPLVVLTAAQDLAQVRDVGDARYLEKPFDLDDLLTTIESAAEERSAPPANT